MATKGKHRMSEYWDIVHAWNEHKQHRHCMVCMIDMPPGGDPRDWDIMEFLAKDFATAAAQGRLVAWETAMIYLQPPAFAIDATVEPIVIGPA